MTPCLRTPRSVRIASHPATAGTELAEPDALDALTGLALTVPNHHSDKSASKHEITTHSTILTKSTNDTKYRHTNLGNVSFALHWCFNNAHMQKPTLLIGFQLVSNNIQ